MYMIEITENKLSNLSEHVEEALKHIGKVMQCVSELGEESSGLGERMGMRDSYRDSYRKSPYRGYDDYEDRSYRNAGRYSRY